MKFSNSKLGFGQVFRYRAKLNNSEYMVWRVLAETLTDADAKITEYLAECKKNSSYNAPTKVEFINEEDGLVLF